MIPIWFERLNMAISTKTSVDGLWVGAFGDNEAELLQKVRHALGLIKTYDPVRYKRILLDVRKIWITMLPGSIGRYQVQTESCQIDSRFVASCDPVFIASVIVHEACHARMRRFGYAESLRCRLEKACSKQQYNFAGRHPGGETVRDWLDSYVARQPEDYTDQACTERHRQALATAARDLGVPDWLMRRALGVRDFLEKRAERRRNNTLRQQRSS